MDKSDFLEWVHVPKIPGRIFWGEKKRLRQDSQENVTFRMVRKWCWDLGLEGESVFGVGGTDLG